MDNIKKQKINTKLLQEEIDDNLLNGSIEITLLNRIYKDKLCEKLKQLGLDKIVFDWQAFEEETDATVMGRKGLYTYLMDSLIRAKGRGLNVDVHFIPMKPNYRELPDIMECLEIAGVENISILNFVPQGRGRVNKEELMLSDEELREFSTILNKAKDKFSGNVRIGIPLNGRIAHLCTAGTEKLDIR